MPPLPTSQPPPGNYLLFRDAVEPCYMLTSPEQPHCLFACTIKYTHNEQLGPPARDSSLESN